MLTALKHSASFQAAESHHWPVPDLVLNFLTDWISIYVTTKLLLIKFSFLIKGFSGEGGIL